MKNPLIGIIGGEGKMGQYFKQFFEKQGHKVIISGRKTELSNEQLAKRADVVIVSVPIDRTESVIREVAPRVKKSGLLMDLTSFKLFPMEAMKATKASYLGCHPMFGPTAKLSGEVIVLCPGRGKKWFNWLEALFKKAGALVRVASAKEHDKYMAYIQALTHFSDIAFTDALRKSGIPIGKFIEYQSSVYRLEMDMMGRILAQNPNLYANIQINNPLSPKVIRSFIESCNSLLETIDRQDVRGNEQFFRQCAQYMGDFCETAMKESDQLLAYLDNDTAEAQSVKDCNIAILGPKNTYSELALRSYDRKAKPYYAKTISEVFELVASGKIQEGLVPLENSSSGSVRETLDELYHEPVGIDKVIAQKIELALVGQKKIALSRIKRIYSHQQPLLQSYAFIKKHCSAASLMPVFSTTEAIRRTIREGKGEVAAIASESAAKALGLTVLRHRIQDDNNNTTLFALIKKISKTDSKKGKKTSIAFHFGKDAPGSLHGILELFAKAGINLSKIESRPNRKLRGEYVFYLDFEKGMEDKAVQGVLKTIEAKVSHLKVLGSY